MRKTRVLFLMQEIFPYVDETKLSTIGRFLPQGIQEKGREIRTFMPRYGSINERRNQLHEVIRLSGMNLIIDDTDHPLIIKVASIQLARLQVYFIDNEDYFLRKGIISDENGVLYPDNDERGIFFTRGVIETVKKLSWSPDIIHCHGWTTSMMPLYLKKVLKDNPIFNNAKIVYSIYDKDFEMLDENFGKKVVMPGVKPADVKHLDQPTYENVTKFAIDFADAIIISGENVPDSIKEYAKNSGKPTLDYHTPETFVEAYNSFYDEVLVNESVLAD